MTGNDVLFGEGQDDDLLGGYGNDWISGGTGDDGVLGDDGRIFTSRNGTAEPLTASRCSRPTQGTVDSTGGNVQQADHQRHGPAEEGGQPHAVQPRTRCGTRRPTSSAAPRKGHSDDIIFGGWGNDFLHGGSGDDAISGAEALTESYAPTSTPSACPTGGCAIDYDHPSTRATCWRYNPVDANGKSSNRTRAGEFALYDEYDPLRKILLDANRLGDDLGGRWHADGRRLFPELRLR